MEALRRFLREKCVPSRRGKINKPALGVGGDQLDGDPVAYVQAFAALDEHSIHVGVESADERAVLVDAGDNGRKALADAGAQNDGGDALLHLALDLAGAIFHQGAANGDGVEIAFRVRLWPVSNKRL